jgi:hypothetical protein
MSNDPDRDDVLCPACGRYYDRCRCSRWCELYDCRTNHSTTMHLEAVALLPEEP